MQQLAASDSSVGKLHPSYESAGAVQMRIKSPSDHHDRSSQSKSMVFSENLKVIGSVSTGPKWTSEFLHQIHEQRNWWTFLFFLIQRRQCSPIIQVFLKQNWKDPWKSSSSNPARAEKTILFQTNSYPISSLKLPVL
uniref:Uncharacterized protein n=1 Tax=Laticauda laticaudata TaxID=8630 RepID=A0A8C5RPQ7_LATLA